VPLTVHSLQNPTADSRADLEQICIEHLNVKALSRGRNARSINDAAFGEIRRQLTYKTCA